MPIHCCCPMPDQSSANFRLHTLQRCIVNFLALQPLYDVEDCFFILFDRMPCLRQVEQHEEVGVLSRRERGACLNRERDAFVTDKFFVQNPVRPLDSMPAITSNTGSSGSVWLGLLYPISKNGWLFVSRTARFSPSCGGSTVTTGGGRDAPGSKRSIARLIV